jgi:D-aminopeptidase
MGKLKNHTTELKLEEMQLIRRLRRHLGMIQQERQNNIINILGGHSYAM